MHEALEGDLRVRRNRQAGLRADDHFDGFAEQASRGVVLVLAVRNLDPRHHEQRRMHAAHHRDRARLTELVPAPHDQVSVLALRRHYRGDAAVLGLDAVSAVVDPPGVGVLHDHHAAGADVTAAVVLVPFRGRDFENVDVASRGDVLHQRPVVDRHRRNGLGVLHVGAPVAHEVHLARVGRHAESEIDPPHRGEDVRNHPMAPREAGDVVEHHRRRPHGALVDVDDAADLLVAPGAGDGYQLAGRLHLRQPDAEVLLGGVAQTSPTGARHGVQHGAPSIRTFEALANPPPICHRPVKPGNDSESKWRAISRISPLVFQK